MVRLINTRYGSKGCNYKANTLTVGSMYFKAWVNYSGVQIEFIGGALELGIGKAIGICTLLH